MRNIELSRRKIFQYEGPDVEGGANFSKHYLTTFFKLKGHAITEKRLKQGREFYFKPFESSSVAYPKDELCGVIVSLIYETSLFQVESWIGENVPRNEELKAFIESNPVHAIQANNHYSRMTAVAEAKQVLNAMLDFYSPPLANRKQ